MNNPVCAVCGHVNRVGAVACEACDARLYSAEGAADDFEAGREPFDSSDEPSWAASETSGPGGAWPPAEDIPPSPADDIPAPPFKSAGDVISPMLAVYRKHFTFVGALVLVTMVPEGLLQYLFLGLGRVGGAGGGARGLVALAAVGGVLLWLLAMVCGSLLTAALIYGVVDLQRTGSASAGECLKRGLKALPMVVLVTILYTIVTVCGYVLLIVPGVIFSLMFSVCVPALVVEGLGPIDAMKRSYELTKGYKGLIFATFFLWGILVTVLNLLVTWSFTNAGYNDLLPTLLIQTAVLGMLSSSLHVLTAYIYLGLLRERRSGFQTNTFTPGPEAAA